MITITQIRAARGILGWSQTELADQAGLTQRTITDIETGKSRPSYAALTSIESVFSQSGVEFIEGGVREKKDNLTVLKGDNFANRFVDFMYNTIESQGLKETLLNGINQEHLPAEGRAKVMEYISKINALGVEERILVPETMDPQFMTGEPHQYRGLAWDYFSDTTPTFIFGNYYAVMMFDIQEVWIIKNKSFANFQRQQFELMWQQGKVFSVSEKWYSRKGVISKLAIIALIV